MFEVPSNTSHSIILWFTALPESCKGTLFTLVPFAEVLPELCKPDRTAHIIPGILSSFEVELNSVSHLYYDFHNYSNIVIFIPILVHLLFSSSKAFILLKILQLHNGVLSLAAMWISSLTSSTIGHSAYSGTASFIIFFLDCGETLLNGWSISDILLH